MCQFSTRKAYFLINVSNKTVRIDICHGLDNLVFEVLLHLRDIADAFLRKTLKLCDINIGTVYSQGRILWQMHLFEQIMVVLCSGSELYDHRYADMILHDGMHFHPSFLLAGLRMTANSFEYVVKQADCGGIHHIQEFFPVLRLVCLPLVALGWPAVR